jgi:hypothetical protein
VPPDSIFSVGLGFEFQIRTQVTYEAGKQKVCTKCELEHLSDRSALMDIFAAIDGSFE